MNFKRIFFAVVLIGSQGVHALSAETVSPRQVLNDSIAKLQTNPDDKALREKIVKLAVTLKPVPAVPEEARRHFVQGATLQKEAKGPTDYKLAVSQYQKALLAAPWWPEAYYNLAVAQESLGDHSGAIESLKLYLLTNPPPTEAREAQDKVYALEAKQLREQASAEEESRKPTFEGVWDRTKPTRIVNAMTIEKAGNEWMVTAFGTRMANVEVDGHRIVFERLNDFQGSRWELVMSADGTRLEGRAYSLPQTAQQRANMRDQGIISVAEIHESLSFVRQ